MESLGQRFKGKSTNMGSYKISKEKLRGLLDLTPHIASLEFNDPRSTDDRFPVFSSVSTKIFLNASAINSDSAFLSSVVSTLAFS